MFAPRYEPTAVIVLTRFIPVLLVLSVVVTMASPLSAADPVPGEDFCNRNIDRIVFAGNHTTKPQVLLREIHQRIDTPCSLDEIIDSIQSIMDLGLFKSVLADLELQGEQLQLRFSVVEKVYFLVIPRLSRTSDAELRGGAQLRFDNFLGRLHQMRLTSERRQEDDGDGPGGFVHRLNYDIPRFFGSDYGFSLQLGSDRRGANLAMDGTEYGVAQSETQTVGMNFTHWPRQSRGVQGLRYFAGFLYAHRDYKEVVGELGPFSGGTDVSWVLGFENRQLHQDLFRRRGTVVGAQLRVANGNTGSDFNYTRADFYAMSFMPLSGSVRNLNVLARIGISDGAAFGERSYSLGGGELLRGMKGGVASGDIMALLNIEYLQAFFNYPKLRWVLFGDAGNVYLQDKIDVLNIRVRGGLGLRWKLESLSNTDLRLDVAWDPQREKMQGYFSTNLTF